MIDHNNPPEWLVELQSKVRHLGCLLAYNQEANWYTPKYYEMKKMHDKLLRRLEKAYKLS